MTGRRGNTDRLQADREQRSIADPNKNKIARELVKKQRGKNDRKKERKKENKQSRQGDKPS